MAKAKDPFPLDRGWAWVIVCGCFVCVFFMVGTAKSTGMFLSPFQEQFNVPTSLAAMVMGGSAIVYAVMAPVCIMLAQMFSVRQVIMVGGLIGFVGMSVSSLLFSMEYVIATFGICFGLGNASIYGNCLVILGLYFDKRRSLANGLALSGSSIGQFVLPPLIEYLLASYGLGGCLLLMGGVYLHIVAAASLFRPLSYWARGSSSKVDLPLKEMTTERDDKEEEVHDNSHVPHLLNSAKVAFCDDLHRGAIENSIARNAATANGREADDAQTPLILPGVEKVRADRSGNLGQNAVDGQVVSVDGVLPALAVSLETGGDSVDSNKINTVDQNLAEDNLVLSEENHRTALISHTERDSVTAKCGFSSHQNLTEGNFLHSDSENLAHNHHSSAFDMSSAHFQAKNPHTGPLRYRSHMNSTGSLCIQPLYGSTVRIEELQTPEEEPEEGGEKKTAMDYCRDLVAMFDFSVMKSYVAVLITISNFLAFFGYFNFVLFLPATMESRGIEKYQKAILVSVTGIGDLIGRLTMAAVGDHGFVQRYKLQAGGIFTVGVNIAIMVWADTYGWLIAHCALYGFFGGIYVSLTAVVIIDFVGLKQMPRVLAVVLLIQGIGASIGQPLLGAVKDATGSFQNVLLITAICCMAAGLVLLAYPLALRLERRRTSHAGLVLSGTPSDVVIATPEDPMSV